MINVSQAEKIISQNIPSFPTIECPLTESYGTVLREDIFADRDQPAFDKVLMDGIAINYSEWREGRRDFKIQGIQAAGTKALELKNSNYCIEVMTGCVLPSGTDCVIPVEQIQIKNKHAKLTTSYPEIAKSLSFPTKAFGGDNSRIDFNSIQLQPMQNILREGSDYKKGERLLKSGTYLLPPAAAVVAAVGKKAVKVSSRPKIAIISTGDELVDLRKPIKPFQIRTSNSYALHAALQKNGFRETQMFHLKDDRRMILQKIRWILKNFGIVMLSGGVSMGKFDYVPEVLTQLGVKVLFHKVRQKPGKPFWFGVKKNGPAVFALPGNPASTLVCFYRYALPQLKRSSGLTKISQEFAVLGGDVQVSSLLTNFLPVVANCSKDGELSANLVSTSGSGDYLALAKSDGFVELEEGRGRFVAKMCVPFYRW